MLGEIVMGVSSPNGEEPFKLPFPFSTSSFCEILLDIVSGEGKLMADLLP